MIILADENIAAKLIERLRGEGHSVSWIMEGLRGSNDPTVLEQALATDALLITEDKDFGDLIFSQGLESASVLLLRLQSLPFEIAASRVCAVIRTEKNSLLGQFSVLTPAGLRTREI